MNSTLYSNTSSLRTNNVSLWLYPTLSVSLWCLIERGSTRAIHPNQNSLCAWGIWIAAHLAQR